METQMHQSTNYFSELATAVLKKPMIESQDLEFRDLHPEYYKRCGHHRAEENLLHNTLAQRTCTIEEMNR